MVMTTSVAECINSCLKFARQLPMLTLAEFIRNMLHRWFHDRHHTAQSMSQQLIDTAHFMILKRVEKCAYMTVNPVDRNIFFVKRSRKQWTVDLAWKTCTCNKFQMDMFPCSHALAAARFVVGSYKTHPLPSSLIWWAYRLLSNRTGSCLQSCFRQQAHPKSSILSLELLPTGWLVIVKPRLIQHGRRNHLSGPGSCREKSTYGHKVFRGPPILPLWVSRESVWADQLSPALTRTGDMEDAGCVGGRRKDPMG
ncbi:hypothetical protein Ddye_000911 [Dipteronia dyeriana]|uniref:SWIM-type domain-containing protein n=1 Tax=Dipteronia dyeriana TaxID=168575 RepID=A0AAE0CSZ8_9ROSI|nr:hypothetical protein Ddye_000911 [Dipteronia dyeriana]